MTPRGNSVAAQCRELGLKLGDTIIGKEGGRRWWNEARLTLLWLGETEAAWLVSTRSHLEPEWSTPKEEVCWTLNCRDWQIEPQKPEA